MERSKIELSNRAKQKLVNEGLWSSLYHEYKANRSFDLAYIPNIKINNKYITGVEKTTEVLVNTLIPDVNLTIDSEHYTQIRAWATFLPLSLMSDLLSVTEIYKPFL